MTAEPIRAVIGVSYRHNKGTGALETFYVKRSDLMENYSGVWTLTSIQYTPRELRHPTDMAGVSALFRRMSKERCGGVPVEVHEWMIGGRSDENPMGRMVELDLYRVSFKEEPKLDPRFYRDAAWLTQEEFSLRTVLTPLPCGLCLRLWDSYKTERGL